MDERIGVLAADGDRTFRDYMELLTAASEKYALRAAFPLAADALSWCREHGAPELVVMEVLMSEGPDGITAAGLLKQSWPGTKIILTAADAESDWIDKARAAGADSFWFKVDAGLSLPALMDETMAGRSVFPVRPPERMLGRLSSGELTTQQRRVLRLLTEGLSNREIAERLVISHYTVKDHLDEIMERADIHSRTALAVRAARLGIVVSEAERLREAPNGELFPGHGAKR